MRMLISILQSKCFGEQTNQVWLLRSEKCGHRMRNWVLPEEQSRQKGINIGIWKTGTHRMVDFRMGPCSCASDLGLQNAIQDAANFLGKTKRNGNAAARRVGAAAARTGRVPACFPAPPAARACRAGPHHGPRAASRATR